MKVWNFLVWQWNQFDSWQRVWLLGAACFGAGLTASDQVGSVLLRLSAGIFLFWFFKCFVWDGIIFSWNRYQQEQQKIVDILKQESK
jgi:hypothetical protein